MPARKPKVIPLAVSEEYFVEGDQVGLVLPNGKIVWPPADYKGRSLASQEDRAAMLNVLKASAKELDHDEDEFLGHYRWATRHVAPQDVYPITHEEFVATENKEEKVNANTNGQH